jgi:hypothetical protein
MTKFNLILLSIAFFLMGKSTLVSANNKIDVEAYLTEVKNCINSNVLTSKIPLHLRPHIKEINVNDYVSHTLLDSKELIIQFKKSKDGGFVSIELDFDLNKDIGCGRISAYEIES